MSIVPFTARCFVIICICESKLLLTTKNKDRSKNVTYALFPPGPSVSNCDVKTSRHILLDKQH